MASAANFAALTSADRIRSQGGGGSHYANSVVEERAGQGVGQCRGGGGIVAATGRGVGAGSVQGQTAVESHANADAVEGRSLAEDGERLDGIHSR